jgi:hypothetical protein
MLLARRYHLPNPPEYLVRHPAILAGCREIKYRLYVPRKNQTPLKSNSFLSAKGLSDPRIITCVASSTAIETGEQVKGVEAKLKRHRSAKCSAVKLA